MSAREQAGRSRPPTTACLCAAALSLLPGAGLAGELTASATAELDQEGGWRLAAGLRGDIGAATRWDLGASRSELEDDLSGLTTTRLDAGLRHRFGAVAVDASLGWWQDEDVVDALVYGGAVSYEGESFFAAVLLEQRRSDFEPFRVAGLIDLPNRDPVPVFATADCELDDTGTGAEAGWLGGGWYAAVDGMSYDYDAADCTFDAPVLDALARAGRRVFAQLAGRIGQTLSRSAGFRLRADNAFLDHRWGIQAGLERSASGYWLRYDRAEERFQGLESQTLTLGLNLYRPAGTLLGVYAGVSDGDGFDTLAFVGFTADVPL
ncbi:MAG TPA: hypothetical protein VJ883_08135 [Woeseiaceae bacterium]|nr:hypothetical protein [Woeseiaceae bacterium]